MTARTTVPPATRLVIAGTESDLRVVPYPPHVVESFWAQTEKTHTCWLFTGPLHNNGYGQYCMYRLHEYAHRMAYEMCIGPIPEGMEIDHVAARGCTHRNCVNPDHLEAVPPKVNKLRSRSFCAANAQKSHCAQGHEFTPENTYIWHGPNYVQRKCRICKREGNRRHQAKLAAARGGAG